MSSPETLFGPFRFDPARRVLWQGETPVQLGSRTLAILNALIETPGRLVSRAELFDRAWPVLKHGLRVEDGGGPAVPPFRVLCLWCKELRMSQAEGRPRHAQQAEEWLTR